MPFSPEDLNQMMQLTSVTVSATPSDQRLGTTTGNKAEPVDERFFRKISIFKGENFKDFAFQFKSAARGSNEIAHNLLNGPREKKSRSKTQLDSPPLSMTMMKAEESLAKSSTSSSR